jgi:hypothetical protein
MDQFRMVVVEYAGFRSKTSMLYVRQGINLLQIVFDRVCYLVKLLSFFRIEEFRILARPDFLVTRF